MAHEDGPGTPAQDPDGYTVRQAAKLLGRSERLIRKLVQEERLEVVGQDPLRVSAASVMRERGTRKGVPSPSSPPAGGLSAEQLDALVRSAVSAVVSELLPRMLETQSAIEQRLTAEVARLQLEVSQTRAELDAERSRKWWRRS